MENKIIENETQPQQQTEQSTYQEPLSWHQYFMSICLLSAQRSKDPSTKVGACIVNEKNHIIGIGYNGFPMGCSDTKLPWNKNDPDWLKNKYPYVVHSEMNAIMNVSTKIQPNSRMYVSLFPCNECAKMIIQTGGIKEVIYKDDKNIETDAGIASRRLFDLVGIKYIKYNTLEPEYCNVKLNI
jgi:dCMP deaminase